MHKFLQAVSYGHQQGEVTSSRDQSTHNKAKDRTTKDLSLTATTVTI